MNKIYVDLLESDLNHIQRTMYEHNAMQSVISMYLNDHANDADSRALDTPIFKAYQDRYAKKAMEYDNEKNALTEKYVPEDIKNVSYEWNVNFVTGQLEITVKDDNETGCKCCK